jgi:DUF2075 family protein/phage repressor protein C with HTH and peptisase S24 domain/DNA replication protein DnaC
MRLYSGTSLQFIQDTIQNQIAEKLKNAFFSAYGFNPSDNELRSWHNSLRAVKDVFQLAKLTDHGVILEYQLPLTSRRLDCLICGKNKEKKDNAVIIELKQWDHCEEADGTNEVLTWVGGGKREILHPSVQVGNYQMWLKDTHTAFYEGLDPIELNACTYLHNYNYYEDDVLLAKKFEEVVAKYPLFTADDVDNLSNYLIGRLENGEGIDVLKRVEESKYRPSKKLMEHVSNIIKGNSEYILLDEQLIVYDKVLSCAKKGFHDKQKIVLIIKGGPGTGKSVIAINLMADLLARSYNAHYATGSRAFTQTLRKIIGRRGSVQFKYFNSYRTAENNDVDVLICDEAHRIRETSNSRYTKKEKRSNLPQIQELINVSKVSVFFIDDHQVVRPNEIGSSDYIRDFAKKNDCKIFEYELETQFRCKGSEAFVNWINNTLRIWKTANAIWNGEEGFDFKIFDSPEELEQAIREKVKEDKTGRVTAGFCWDWSKPNPDGTLKNDVVIGGYERPWNARPESKKLAPGIPGASLWANEEGGIDQVGCVYTAQGFEFDYVGVIFGKDLRYNFDTQEWEGHKEESSDSVVKRSKDQFIDLVKNTYRVLLSRGMEGCYVYFMDKDTERFFKSRMEKPVVKVGERKEEEILLEVDDEEKFVEYLPVYSLKAAAGKFSGGQDVKEEGWIKADIGQKLGKNMFVAKVVGHSMEPRIPDNSYCVFSFHSVGSRQGKIVLAQHRDIQDVDTGGSYTVKKYRSEKKVESEDNWHHEKIILEPLNKDYEPIIVTPESEGDFKIIAEFITVL